MTFVALFASNFKYILYVSRQLCHEQIPRMCINNFVRGLTSVPPQKEILEEETPKSSPDLKTLQDAKNLTFGDGLKFHVEEQPSFPKSSFREKGVAEDFSTHPSDDPDSFGNLSGLTSLRTELYEGDEGDKKDDEYISFKPHKLPQKKYMQIIRKFLSQRRFADALNVLHVRMLKEDKVQPDYYVYGILINFCGKVGYTKMAFKLFTEMKSRQLTVPHSIYTSLFNACSNSPFPEDGLSQARYLRRFMLEKSIIPPGITCHAMIKAFGRCGDLNAAFEIADYMMQNKMTLKCETFSFLFHACISDKEAGFRHALLVYKKMREYRIKPDCFTFNLMLRCVRDTEIGDKTSMIDVLHKLGLNCNEIEPLQNTRHKQITANLQENTVSYPWEESPEEVSEVISGFSKLAFPVNELPSTSSDSEVKTLSVASSRTNVFPNLFAYPPTLGAVVSLDDLKEPHERLFLLGGFQGYLNEMVKYNVKPDIKTATLLLECLPKTCQAEDALVKELEHSHGVQLDIGFFNTLIKRRAYRKQPDEAKKVLSMIGNHGCEVDLITYGGLAMTCGSVFQACELVKAMEQAGLRPNIVVLTTFLRRALHSFNWKFIELVFEIREYEEMPVNSHFMTILENFYKKSRNLPENNTYNIKATEFMKKFCVYYPRWKKSLEVESEDKHPWEQFQREYQATKEDEPFFSECVEPEQFKSSFPRLGSNTPPKLWQAKMKRLKDADPERFRKPSRRILAHQSDDIYGISLKDLNTAKSSE